MNPQQDLRASSPTPLPPLPQLALDAIAAAALAEEGPAPSPHGDGAGAGAAAAAAAACSARRRRLLAEQRQKLHGPTPWSNWIIPGRLLAGGFPASPDDADTRHTLLRLMGAPAPASFSSSGGGGGVQSSGGGQSGGGGQCGGGGGGHGSVGGGCGVTAFICLQSELDPRASPSAWRRGAALRPYPRDAAALLAEAGDDRSGGKVLELPALGPSAVVSCYGDGPAALLPPPPPASADAAGAGGGSGSACPWPPPPPPLDPFTATADAVGPGGSAAASAAAAGGRPPVPRDSPSASLRPGDPRGGRRVLLRPERRVDFLHLPIPDGGTAPDAALSALADDVAARLRAGQVCYAHCWGGHGRTGSLVACVLARLYGLSAAGALAATQACHDARVFPQGTRSPQTLAQRQQVARVVAAAAGQAGAAGGQAGLGGLGAGGGRGGGGVQGDLAPSAPPQQHQQHQQERERVGADASGQQQQHQQHQQQQHHHHHQQQHRAGQVTPAAAAAGAGSPPKGAREAVATATTATAGDAERKGSLAASAAAAALLLRKRMRSPSKIPADPAA